MTDKATKRRRSIPKCRKKLEEIKIKSAGIKAETVQPSKKGEKKNPNK